MIDDFSEWIGKSEVQFDTLEPARSHALLSALGDTVTPVSEGKLPLLHHWLYFWDVRPSADLGADGHPQRGGFLPPVPLPRRMWAGGRIKFIAALRLGERVERKSRILAVEGKRGKSGPLVFVTIRHELVGKNGLAIVEEQDIVFRDAAVPGSFIRPANPAPKPSQWRREIVPDTVMLFRYSALTMNGHRIHYDRPYAIAEEAYPGLVVHGPLQATLLADFAERKLERPLTRFEYRGLAPAFDQESLGICACMDDDRAELWTEQGGAVCMYATAI